MWTVAEVQLMAKGLASLQAEQLEELRKKPGTQLRATVGEEQVTQEA